MSDLHVEEAKRALRVLERHGINPATLCTPQQIVAALPDDEWELEEFLVRADPGALVLRGLRYAADRASNQIQARRYHPEQRQTIGEWSRQVYLTAEDHVRVGQAVVALRDGTVGPGGLNDPIGIVMEVVNDSSQIDPHG